MSSTYYPVLIFLKTKHVDRLQKWYIVQVEYNTI